MDSKNMRVKDCDSYRPGQNYGGILYEDHLGRRSWHDGRRGDIVVKETPNRRGSEPSCGMQKDPGQIHGKVHFDAKGTNDVKDYKGTGFSYMPNEEKQWRFNSGTFGNSDSTVPESTKRGIIEKVVQKWSE